MASNTQRILEQAVNLHRAGRLQEAGAMYRNILEVDPKHGDSLHLLGVVSHQAGRSDLAVELIGRALEINKRNPDFHLNMGEAYRALGRREEAASHFNRALKLKRDHWAAHNNLGIVLMDEGKLREAIVHFRRAVMLRPDYAEAHMNFGLALMQQGKYDDAGEHFEQALELNPSYAEAHNSVGALLMRQGRVAEAVSRFERAIELKPNYPMAYRNLGQALFAQGKLEYALAAVRGALDLGKDDARSLFVQVVKDLQPTQDPEKVRELIVRAISEGWDRPVELARVGASLIKQSADVQAAIQRAMAAWPQRLSMPDLLGPSGLAGLKQDRLLRCLLESAPAMDIELEQFLAAVRFGLLEAAAAADTSEVPDADLLAFYAALAQQCFINEYVFTVTPDEQPRAAELRRSLEAALQSGANVPLLWPLAVADYFPLHSLSGAAELLNRKWPEPVARVMTQQVIEPAQEQQIRLSIPRLTDIDDRVSLLVKQQYEENPYPRWVMLPLPATRITLDDHLKEEFAYAAYRPAARKGTLDILIAGCGTGQQPINTASRFQDARVLAVDLSLTSLGYAQRKTREVGLANIEYAQADLLKLASLGRSFDLIESSGVLHHMADPLEGWRVLLSLLRPGGVMEIGLYSAAARGDVVAIRNLIAERGYAATADDIRRCRQELIELELRPGLISARGRLLHHLKRSHDFYSTSGCRDLLFHVQEHRFTIPQIKAFLGEQNLTFLGFDLDERVMTSFKNRFAGIPDAVTDLDLWEAFERDQPRTFAGMYQFAVQKN